MLLSGARHWNLLLQTKLKRLRYFCATALDDTEGDSLTHYEICFGSPGPINSFHPWGTPMTWVFVFDCAERRWLLYYQRRCLGRYASHIEMLLAQTRLQEIPRPGIYID